MKKNHIINFSVALFAASISFSNVNAQNIVANSDFSSSIKAPRSVSQVERATDWMDANWGTADFYHKNASKCSKMGIPNNTSGSQEAFKGEGYIGIIAYYDDEVLGAKDGKLMYKSGYNKFSEFVSSKLSSPLVAGQTYTMKFRVSLAENSGRAVSGLGMHFSKDALVAEHNTYIKAEAHVVSNTVIDSKDKWVEISGMYTAKGGEQYITIGLFNGPKEVKRAAAMNETNNKKAYYYIDGVEVMPGEFKDRDKDGVADADDKCPDVKGPADNKGCPIDTDGDGIADADDKCPKVKGVKSNNGCPADRDKDGVADADDKCPDVKGKAEYGGCPLSDEETKIIKDASANVFFETGSAVIKKSSYADLDRLVAILKKHPEVKATVEGHTDNTGNAEKNLKLSQARAKSVADYLVSHGEPADHISSAGFGITRPIATNDTPDGRAKNRRVAIVVSSYEAK